MAATTEALRIPLSPDDIRARSHAAGNDSHIAFARANRTLSGDEDVLVEVHFTSDVIVMAVNGLQLRVKWRYLARIADCADDLLHHQLTVPPRVILRPLYSRHVGEKVLGVFGEIREIDVGQINTELLHVFAGKVDEVVAHAVAYAA